MVFFPPLGIFYIIIFKNFNKKIKIWQADVHHILRFIYISFLSYHYLSIFNIIHKKIVKKILTKCEKSF